MSRKNLVAWGVGIAALTLVATACSESASGATGPGLEGDPIKIGMAVSLSGAQSSSVTAAAPTARAWQEEVNQNGGLGGRPVEIVIEDSKNTAGGAQSAVRKLVEDDGIVAMMVVDSVAEGAIGEYLQAQNIPVIGSTGYNSAVWNSQSNFFMTSPNSATVVKSLVTGAEAANAKEFSAAVCAESATCADDASKAFVPSTAAAGIGFGGAVTVSTTAANYTAECLNFKQKNTDYIAMLVTVDTVVRVMTDCIQQGYEGTFGTSSSSFNPSKYGAVPGMKMVGTINGFPWWADAAPAQKFRDALEQYEPDTDYASASATTTWSNLELFKKAVGDNTADVTRDSVFDGYYALDGETLDGLLPQPVKFVKGEPSLEIDCFWQFDFNSGDSDPTLVAPTGTSGNGATGDLASACAAA